MIDLCISTVKHLETFSHSFSIPQANFVTGYYERKISASKQHDRLKEMENTEKHSETPRFHQTLAFLTSDINLKADL